MSSIFPGPSSSMPSFILKNVTIDDNDSSLKYSQGWNRSLSSLAIGGSFHIADHVGDLVSFNLPANAVAIYYVGYQQSAGGLYEACLDCSTQGTGQADVVDAFNNATRSTEPTLLYENTHLDPSVSHTFALSNLADARFGNTSTITLDAFVVTVQEKANSASASQSLTVGSAASLVMQVPISTSSQSLSSASSSEKPTSSALPSDHSTLSSASSSEQPTSSSASASEQPTLPPAAPGTSTEVTTSTTSSSISASASPSANRGQSNLNAGQRLAEQMRSPLALTGIILAVLFVVCTSTFALMYFMRRRRRRSKAPYTQISEQTALFFSAMKKAGGRVSIFAHGASSAGGSSRMVKDAMVEKLVPDKPQPFSRYAPHSSSATPLASHQVPALPPSMAYNTFSAVPRSLFRPPGTQPISVSRLPSPTYSSEGPSSNSPSLQRIPDGARVNAPEAVTTAVEPALMKTGAPGTVRHTHPYNNPFVIAEAEARAREREKAQARLMGHGTHRRDSSSSVGSLYSQGEGVRQNPQPPPPSATRSRTENAWDSV